MEVPISAFTVGLSMRNIMRKMMTPTYFSLIQRIPIKNKQSKASLNSIGEGTQSYRFMIIIGYIFAILGSVLGFIFAIYLITRKDPTAKKHGIIQLALLIIEFAFVGYLIYSGQMDINMILDPFNSTQLYNMTNMYNSSQNITASNNFSSLFGLR